MLRASGLRYLIPFSVVAVAVMLVPQLALPQPIGGIVTMAIVVIAAWFGGLGPALLICPLILASSRLNEDKSWVLTQKEMVAFGVISVITTAVGLAGQYRRQFKTVGREHAQKLRDQARALSLAHILFCDLKHKVTEWNEGAEQMFGWTREVALGRNLHELLKSQLPRPLEEIHSDLYQWGQWQGEVVHHHKDGAPLVISAHWILFRDENGKAIGIAKIMNDVSELRRAEEAVREADHRKDVFLAMLAHELRNPLAPIRLGLEMMKMAKDEPETLEEIRSTMERQTQQLVTLVDDLLDVSRITRGKLELRKSRVKLEDAIQSALEASRSFIEEAGHQLHVTAIDPRISLDADPNRLAQVFSNLLNNAAKFTAKGGVIELKAERQGSDVLVSVQDNGIGIAKDMLEHIFEMFAQVASPDGVGSQGLGIGLTLVKSLVEMHGGRVEVHSDGPMTGSTFTVRLPILVDVQENGKVPTVSHSETSLTPRRRVLVVDDNLAAVKLLSMVVQSLGNDVRTAYNGQEAIDVAAAFLPEVVLMDLGMPRMNGFEAARHIREQPWGQNMLLVALSGWGQEDDKRKTKEAGFDHHLTKPAEPAELRRLLASAARNQGSASPVEK
jgi:PAS domain S-box-containing protein